MSRRSVIRTTLATFSFLVAVLAAGVAECAPVECTVYESTLNRIVNAVGPLGGRAGYRTVYLEHPCIPFFWNTCRTKLGEGWVTWRTYGNSLDVQSSRIRLGGKIRLSWAGQSYTTDYSTTVLPTYIGSTRKLRLEISAIHLTVRIAGIRLGTYSVDLPYEMELPLGRLRLPLASGQEVFAAPSGVVITTHDPSGEPDFVRISLYPAFQ